MLEQAVREANELKQSAASVEHILLALMREREGVAAHVLIKLGLDLNMSQNTISRYETGAHEAGYAELCRIADYFGVTVDYLLERTDKRD